MPGCIPFDAYDYHGNQSYDLGLPVQPGTLQILYFVHKVYLRFTQDFKIYITISLYSIKWYFVFLT